MFSSLLAVNNTTDINVAAAWFVEIDSTGSIVRFYFDETNYQQITGDSAQAYVLARQAWFPKITDKNPKLGPAIVVSPTLDVNVMKIQHVAIPQPTMVRFYFTPSFYKEITGQYAEDYNDLRQRTMPKLRNVITQLEAGN